MPLRIVRMVRIAPSSHSLNGFELLFRVKAVASSDAPYASSSELARAPIKALASLLLEQLPVQGKLRWTKFLKDISTAMTVVSIDSGGGGGRWKGDQGVCQNIEVRATPRICCPRSASFSQIASLVSCRLCGTDSPRCRLIEVAPASDETPSQKMNRACI